MPLFKFELKRFISSKRNKYLLAIISLIVIGYAAYQTIYWVNSAPGVYMMVFKQGVQVNITNTKSDIKGIQNSLKGSQQLAGDTMLKTTLQYDQKSLTIYQNQLKALNTHNINAYYRLQIESYNADAAYAAVNAEQAAINAQEGNVGKNDLLYLKAVQSRGLDFEVAPNAQAHSFGNFQQQFLPVLTSSLFIVLFVSMVSITVASSFESSENRYYRFMAINSRDDLLAKVAAGVLATYGWILAASLVYFLAIGFVSGFGAWNYPADLSNNITIANAIVDGVSLLYLFPVILFLASLGALLSAWAKRSLVVVGAIAILVMGYAMIENVTWVKPLRRFIPLSYLNPLDLLNNPSYLAGSASIYVGLAYLLLLSGVFMYVAHVLLKNQKIRRI